MTNWNQRKKATYLSGDYNINLLNTDKHVPTAEFLDTMFSYFMYSFINRPTRCIKQSATLIGNIYSKIFKHDILTGIFYTDITDHFPIFYIDYSVPVPCEPSFLLTRQYNIKDMTKFTRKLTALNSADIHTCEDPQTAFTLFHKEYSKMYDQCFPLKKIKINYRNKKPWLTEALRNSIKTKNNFYVISQKHQTVCNVNRYKEYKTKLNRLLKKCEREHYDEKFESYKNDLRKSWNLIKEVINKKRVQGTFNTFIINDEETCDKQTIVEAFNKFYSSIGPELASKIPGSDISPTFYIANSNPEFICLIPVSQEEVSKIIFGLKDSSAGWDKIYSKIVKQTYQHILPMLTHLSTYL